FLEESWEIFTHRETISWRRHSCLPRRDSSRRLATRQTGPRNDRLRTAWLRLRCSVCRNLNLCRDQPIGIANALRDLYALRDCAGCILRFDARKRAGTIAPEALTPFRERHPPRRPATPLPPTFSGWLRRLRPTGSRNRGSGSRFLLRAPPLLRRRLPVALLEVRKHDRQNELPSPMIVEFDHDIFFATGKNAAQSEFGMFHLRALGVRRFVRH